MGSIYNPFAGQNLQQQGDPITTFASRVLPLVHDEKNFEDQRKIKFMQMMQAQQANEAADQPKQPTNTVFHEDISPLEKAKLGLEKQKIDTTRDIASGKLGFQHEKQDTDSAIRQQRADTYSRLADMRDYLASIKMPDEDKLRLTNALNEHMQELKGGQTLEQIGARGGNALDLEQTRQAGRTALEASKQAGRVALKTTPSGTPFQPTQQRAQLRMRAEQFRNEHPDLANYIQIDPNDPIGFQITGPDQDILHGINSQIYGNTSPNDTRLPASGAPQTFTNQAAPGQTPTFTDKPGANAAPKAPTGWKYVPKQGGGWTAVEDTGTTAKPSATTAAKPGGDEEDNEEE